MKIKFCGADQNVTGSCHLLEINGKRILLDCGLFQGGPKEELAKLNKEFLFDANSIDMVVLSHAHIDHCGRLPLLVRQGFSGPIYCTKATSEIADVLLRDSAGIQAQDAKYIKHKFDKDLEPLYELPDVMKTVNLMQTFEYFTKFKLADNIWVTFYDAGHVLGSAIVAIDFKEGSEPEKRLVFTGDLGRKYLPILNDPYQIEKADILIIESTYASHLHDAFESVYEEMTWIINDVVKRGGKIIVPGFAFERTQEIVYVLHELYQQKKIPRLPIFVDSPMAVAISEVFNRFSNYYDKETFKTFLNNKANPFYFNEVKYVESVEESKSLNSFKGSCIIISASGMCEAGRIKHHLANNMADPKNLILVVGFMGRGTKGRQIVEGARKVRFFGQEVPLRADVAVMNEFSAHADKLELLEFIKNINGLKQIFAVHGEETECAVMRDNIYNTLKFHGRVDVPEFGEEFTLDEKGVSSHVPERQAKHLNELRNMKQ